MALLPLGSPASAAPFRGGRLAAKTRWWRRRLRLLFGLRLRFRSSGPPAIIVGLTRSLALQTKPEAHASAERNQSAARPEMEP